MFPPRTEAPTADKIALCYAPHVDMTAVMEIEVRSVWSTYILSSLLSLNDKLHGVRGTINVSERFKFPLEIKFKKKIQVYYTYIFLNPRRILDTLPCVINVWRIWVKVRKCMRQLPHYANLRRLRIFNCVCINGHPVKLQLILMQS